MTINQHDDYEVLAKLIYPSIESAGNVYYGQTRKLTIDELLGKYDLNFNSHIETLQVDSEYRSYFNWKLGPLIESVRVAPLDNVPNSTELKDFTKDSFPGSKVVEVSLDGHEDIVSDNRSLHGVIFAKYLLTFTDKTIDNTLYSGNFVTYENTVNCVYDSIIVRNHLYMDDYDPQNRNFYIKKDGTDWYLYIQIAFDSNYSFTKHELETPFTVKSINGDTTVEIVNNEEKYEYSDNGNTWNNVTSALNVSNGNTICLRVKSGQTVSSPQIHIYKDSAQSQSEAIIYGNINSIKFSDYENISHYDIYSYNAAFFGAFFDDTNINNIVDAKNLILPANSLADSCYCQMFRNCALLKNSPVLHAKNLISSCYSNMFKGCSSLEVAPKLPAISFNEYCDYCYAAMFSGCTSLKVAPELPADNLSISCYSSMFNGCIALVSAPKLNAVNISTSCYSSMFKGCTSLKVAPELPATIVKPGCYDSMFRGCSSLEIAPLLSAMLLEPSCYDKMFYDCVLLKEVAIAAPFDDTVYTDEWLYNAGSDASVTSRIIWCDTSFQDYPVGDSGIPSNWTRKPIYEYIPNTSNDTTSNSTYDDIKRFNVRESMVSGNCKSSRVVLSGSDSDVNGRGKLNNSTKFNMESSFDENDTHKMDTYNSDGSYNQEIWGYKSFNSPVQFRNGIYGECSSVLTYEPSEYQPWTAQGDWEDRSCSGSIIKCGYTYNSMVSQASLSLSNQHGEFDGQITNGSDIVIQASSSDDSTIDATYSGIEVHSYITYDDFNDYYTSHNRLDVNAGESNIHLYDNDSDGGITLTANNTNSTINLTADGHLPGNGAINLTANGLTGAINLTAKNTQVSIANDSINVNKSIIPDNNNVLLGSSSHAFNDIYTSSIHTTGTIIANTGSDPTITNTSNAFGPQSITLSGISTVLLTNAWPSMEMSFDGGGDYHRLKLHASEKQGVPLNTEIRNFGLYSSRLSAASNVLSKVECCMEGPAATGGSDLSNGSVNIYAKKAADPTFAQIQVITEENSPSGSVSKIALTSSEGTGPASATIEIQSENDGNDGHDAFINLNVEGTLRNNCTSYLSFSNGSTKIISSENDSNYADHEYGSVEVDTEDFFNTRCGKASLNIKDDNGVASVVTLAEYTASATANNAIHAIYPANVSNDTHKIFLGTPDNKWSEVYSDKFVGNFVGNDANGHSLTSYIYSATMSGTAIDFINGESNNTGEIILNEPITEVLQGKYVSLDSVYSRIGAVGLFLYLTGTQYGFIKVPGDTVSGVFLKPAGLTVNSGGVTITSDPNVQHLDGTWTLLSVLAPLNQSDDCLVLAVKTSIS